MNSNGQIPNLKEYSWGAMYNVAAYPLNLKW